MHQLAVLLVKFAAAMLGPEAESAREGRDRGPLDGRADWTDRERGCLWDGVAVAAQRGFDGSIALSIVVGRGWVAVAGRPVWDTYELNDGAFAEAPKPVAG